MSPDVVVIGEKRADRAQPDAQDAVSVTVVGKQRSLKVNEFSRLRSWGRVVGLLSEVGCGLRDAGKGRGAGCTSSGVRRCSWNMSSRTPLVLAREYRR